MERFFKNKAHQREYENGYKAAQNESPFCPYGTDNRSSLAFRRAWMRGYDEARAAASAGVSDAEVLRHA
jgi:ribosome modulation factor